MNQVQSVNYFERRKCQMDQCLGSVRLPAQQIHVERVWGGLKTAWLAERGLFPLPPHIS